MRSRATRYKHVVVDFDERCHYSRGEACIYIKDAVDRWLGYHDIYARVNAWFGISTVTAVYVKVCPGNTIITSSISFDKGGRGIPYLASTAITSAVHLSKVLKSGRRRRVAITRVAKEFLENLKDRSSNDPATLKMEIEKWIEGKRRERRSFLP